jgi:hypothetical protein
MADPLAYQKTLQSMYEIAYNAGLGVRLVGDNQITESPAEFASKHPILILHSLYVCSDETLEFARDYAAAGGTLIVGPRTGYAKPDAVIRTETAPAILGEVVGASYSEYSMLAKPERAKSVDGKTVGAGWAWFDELEACVSELPHNGPPLKLLRIAQRRVAGMRVDGLTPAQRHEYLDAVQADLARVHAEIAAEYFYFHEQDSAARQIAATG